jgi:hypothetical protein
MYFALKEKESLEEDIIGLHVSTFNLTTTLKERGWWCYGSVSNS